MTDTVSGTTPVARYNPVAVTLHWLVAALILIGIAAGLGGAGTKGPAARGLIDFHKSIGLTIFGLVLLRILWRWAHTPPPLPRTYSRLERAGALAVHLSLYALMLALPISGYIHDSAWREAQTHPIVLYGLVHFPRLAVVKTLDPATKEHVHNLVGAIHVYLGYVLYGFLALHLLGVAKHHILDHQPELQRMLPPGRTAMKRG